MTSSLVAHAHAIANNEWFATASVTVHLPPTLVVATASLTGFHIKQNAYWPGANAFVSAYRQAGQTQDVNTLASTSLAESSDLLIDRCTRVTFTVAVSEGYATLLGTVFSQDPIDRWVELPPLFTRYVYDPSNGQIRHSHASVVLDGAEVPDDDEWDAAAVDTALWLGALDDGALKVVRGDAETAPGLGLQVDLNTGELVRNAELDLPQRPWLRARPS